MVLGKMSDMTSLTRTALWVADPKDEDLMKLLEYWDNHERVEQNDKVDFSKGTKDAALKLNRKVSVELQKQMNVAKAYSSTVTFHDIADPNHPKTGYRTALPIEVGTPLPETSFICLENTACITLDFLHMCIRIVEKDLKLIVQNLLLRRGRSDQFKQFETNCRMRDIKKRHFSFGLKGTKSAKTAVELEPLSLSGRDARELLTPASELNKLKKKNVCELFEGVLQDHAPPPIENPRAVEILQTLGVIETDEPSERAIGDLLFRSHYQMMR